MTLGEIVRSYRDSHSMTMAEFAERAGLSKGYISMLEKNRNPRTGAPIIPSITTYEGVSKATGLSVQELMESTRGEDISLSVPAAPPAPQKSDGLPELNARDERDIQKRLKSMLDDLDPNAGLAYYNGEEPMDDETRDLIRAALENSLRVAKQIAKAKYTPKKYRNE